MVPIAIPCIALMRPIPIARIAMPPIRLLLVAAPITTGI